MNTAAPQALPSRAGRLRRAVVWVTGVGWGRTEVLPHPMDHSLPVSAKYSS